MKEIGLNILVAFLAFIFGYLSLAEFPMASSSERPFSAKILAITAATILAAPIQVGFLARRSASLSSSSTSSKRLLLFGAAWAILRFSGVRSIEGAPLFDDGVFYNWLTLLGVAVGHCWSPYLKFKGGKTVACYMGAVGGTSWLGGILCFIAFFVPYAFKKGVVSVASLLSGAVLCLFEWAMYLIVALSGWPGTILDVELRSGRRSLLWLGKRQRCYFDLSHSCSSTFGQHQTP
jgi:hypothetical protein